MAKRGKRIKAVLSRLKITNRRKVLRRLSQQSHFKAKESGNIRRRKRKLIRAEQNPFIKKALARYI